MRPITSCLAGLLLVVLTLAPCRALDGADPLTLAAALAQAAPPAGGLALAVAADKVALPPGEAPPGPGATVPQVAAAFHRVTQDFGDATAVAPATVPALNPDPHDPNPYVGMAPSEVFTLLAAGLDGAQWAALTGKGGLGVGDLTSEDQRRLFAALFPGGRLMIHHAPTDADTAQAYATAAAAGLSPERAENLFAAQQAASDRDVSAELPQVRLRLGHRALIQMPVPDRPGGVSGAFASEDSDAPPRWEARSDQFKEKGTLYGVPVRVDVSNALKEGQLDFSLAALAAPVPAAPCKTVGALVAAAAQATHVEIYADRRWEGKPLTVVGAGQAQPARNILRALAVCVGGTYRKVGPAYVLTYDVAGVGTIRQRWAEFSADAEGVKREPLLEARSRTSAAHSFDDLAQMGDPLEPSANQRKRYDHTRDQMTLTYAELTPAQQGFVNRRIAQQQEWHDREQAFIRQYPAYRSVGFPFDTEVPTMQGPLALALTPQVQFLVPSVQEPVASNVYIHRYDLFDPTQSSESSTDPTKTDSTKHTALAPRQPLLAASLAAVSRCAVLAHPRTAPDVDALIGLMRKAHMNALYLDVFSSGASHLGTGPDILDEALTKTRGTGIAVFPTLSLFDWREKAPVAPDLNVFGETSAQTAARRQARQAVPPSASGPLFVSPTAPDVAQTLLRMVQDVAARHGVAGLVWRDATPPGYAPDAGMSGADLGYTEAARLAFLRRTRVDPVDVSFPVYTDTIADLTLPDFDGRGADRALCFQWQAARASEQQALLQSLLAAARPVTALVERGDDAFGGEDWYGSWDGPRASLPAFHHNAGAADVQAKAQSHLALLVLSPEWLLRPDAGAIIQGVVQHSRWDGFVLDADAPRPDAKKAPLPLEAALTEIGERFTSSPPSPSGSPRPSAPPP